MNVRNKLFCLFLLAAPVLISCEEGELDQVEIIYPDTESSDDGTQESENDNQQPGKGDEDPTPNDPALGGSENPLGDSENLGSNPGKNGEQAPPLVLGPDQSGSLIIDGQQTNFKENSIITITGGTYNTIIIRNLSGSKGQPITIRNSNAVTITGSLKTENLNHVVIAGNGNPNVKYGFAFLNFQHTAIDMVGEINGVVIQNMQFKNSKNYYSIRGSGTNQTQDYTGSATTRSEGLKILHCEFDNVGRISFGGDLDKNKNIDKGLFKDVEIAHNIFINTDAGTVCEFRNVEDYHVHHNTVNNINKSNNNHNGVFFMIGNGKFNNNKLTNYQGNAIRMWAYSRGNSPATVEINHNVCYNSRKYGAFEIQTFARHLAPGKTTFINAAVYNNTVGRMNTSKDWTGQLLDLYPLHGGSLTYQNNLGFDLFSDRPITDMINKMSDSPVNQKNNHYAKSQGEAVNNTTDFKSKISGIGAY